MQQVLEEVTRCLNLEKLLPCYHHTVTVACLRAIRTLQKNGHLPSDPTLFQTYAQYGHFMDIRLAALEALIDYVKGRFTYEKLLFGPYSLIAWFFHDVGEPRCHAVMNGTFITCLKAR